MEIFLVLILLLFYQKVLANLSFINGSISNTSTSSIISNDISINNSNINLNNNFNPNAMSDAQVNGICIGTGDGADLNI